MRFKRYTLPGFFLLSMLFWTAQLSLHAAVYEDIGLTIRVVNDRTGSDVTAELKVSDLKTGNALKAKYENSEWKVQAVKGQKLKIIVTADGFYPEDKTVDTETFEGAETLIRLSPRPMAVLVFKTVDDESKALLEAEVEIYHKEKLVKKLQTTKKEAEYRIPLSEAGAYKLAGKSKGYSDEITEMEVNVTDPPNVFLMSLFFKKPGTSSEISFYDKLTSEKVLTADVTVRDKKDNRVLYSGALKDGKLKVESLKNEMLILEVKSKGYVTFRDEIRNMGAPMSLALVPETTVDIDIFDAVTSKRMAADLTVVSPSKKTSKIKSSSKESLRFVPTETGEYSLQATMAGFEPKSGSLTITTLGGGNSLFSMKMAKVAEDYVISVFDQATKAQIKEARIRVFDENKKEVNMSASLSKMIIDPEKKYAFEVSAEGYEDYHSPISENKKIEVFMKKKELPDYHFSVIDADSRQAIPDARFRIFDGKSTPTPVSFDPATKKYVAKLGNGGPYSMEASAKGYLNFKGDVTMAGSREITVSLSPVASDSYVFQAVDDVTGNELAASFKLTSNGAVIDLVKTTESLKVKGALSPLNNYEIEASLTGYSTVKTKVSPQGRVDGVFKLVLKKEFYRAGIAIKNKLTEAELSQLEIVATLPNITNVKLVAEGKPPVYYGDFKADAIYNISASLKGYALFSEMFLLRKLKNQELIYDIELIPLQKEEKKEAEPVKALSKEIADLPDHLNALNAEFSGAEALGKTYRLNKVNFEKSKPKMLDGSGLQLDLLAAALNQQKNLKVEITGHTDSDGNDQRLNQYLSEFRAKVIANYLFNKGIDDDRISVKGKGSSEPLVPNDSDENKAKNRRVEVRIIAN